MPIAERITRRAVDTSDPSSLSSRARAKRWVKFAETFPGLGDMRVLDLGGTPDFWRSAPDRPAHVTTVNLLDLDCDEQWQQHVVADACVLPDLGEFDLVVSNSLLEHVGGHARRQQLADVILRSAPRHWVQTPYRFFPIEPHWMAPVIHWLPMPARVAVSERWPLGNFSMRSRARRREVVFEVELLSVTEMRYYFPTSTIWRERVGGLPKSLVAISA